MLRVRGGTPIVQRSPRGPTDHCTGSVAEGSRSRGRVSRRHGVASPTATIVTGWAVVLCLTMALADERPPSDSPPLAESGANVGAPAAVVPMASETVHPSVETGPSHHPGDTADDMAIWIHPTDPALSLIIGNDKEGGLMVWDLDGSERQYVEGDGYNNVDLRYNFPLVGTFLTDEEHDRVSLVGVGDEGEGEFDFYKVNPYTRLLESAGEFDVSVGPYGGCMYLSVSSGAYYFIAPDTDGEVEQWEIHDGGDGRVAGSLARTFDVGGITEGCVADDLLARLYLAEEDSGIWRYGAEPDAGDDRTQVDSTDGGNLVADVEGLSLYYAGTDVGYLFASSQGESQVAVYTRQGANTFLGKFDVDRNGTIDEVSATDGLDVTNFPLAGPFGLGLFAIHDTDNSGEDASNVKLVGYGGLAEALDLDVDIGWDPRLVGEDLPPPPPPPPFDFAVTVDPVAGTVEPGGSVSATTKATLLSGSPETVAFSCDDLPEAASCDFAPASCSPTCDVDLSLDTDPTTPEGTYTVRVVASNGTASRVAVFLLTVEEAPPPDPFDFTIAVDTAAGAVEAGGSLDIAVEATLVSGSSHDVAFECDDLPSGAACAFTPEACSPTCGVDLTLSTDAETPEGTYSVCVTASDGSISRTATFLLTVTEPPPPPFDFELTVDPGAAVIDPGDWVNLSVEATLVSGTPDDVGFACEGLPAGSSCTFTPPSCQPTCTVALLLTTDTSTPEGTFTVEIQASNGTITRTATLLLTVVGSAPEPVPTALELTTSPNPSVINASVTVSGRLTSDGIGLPNETVVLEYSWDGVVWTPEEQIGTFMTQADGNFSDTMVFYGGNENHTHHLRTRFNGTDTHAASLSPVVDQEVVIPPPPPPPPPIPSPPIAQFTYTPPDPRVGQPIAFDATLSTSDPGTTLWARWDWEADGTWDTTLSLTLTATHTFAAEGTYFVLLEVRDSNDLSDRESRAVGVRPPPVVPDTTPPTIAITSPANRSVLDSTEVDVTGTASDDRALEAVALSLDGKTWTPAAGTHSWSGTLTLREGIQTIFARATDAAQNERVVTVTVDVRLPSASEPTDVAGLGSPRVLLGLLLPIVFGTAWIAIAFGVWFALSARARRRRPKTPSRGLP